MLASIQKIKKVFPIEGADRIEGVEVLGWKCVVRKGIFREGDLCIYIEIDTLVPKRCLSKNPQDKELIRLKTVKMKGQISQGLVLPIIYEEWADLKIREGLDVTDYVGVKKYEKAIPAQLQGLIKGDFPGFLRKTDEVRIQSEPKLLEKIKGKPFYITTKLDGTSATYYKLDGKFGVCSRNLELEKGDNTYWKMAEKYKIEEWLPDGYAIQGEICGEGIQKNPLGIKGQDLYIFNVFDIKNGEYIFPDDLTWFDDTTVGDVYKNEPIKLVPGEEVGKEFSYTLEELLEKAKGKYPNTNKNKEGVVVRSIDQTISFKVVNNDYLLKDEE